MIVVYLYWTATGTLAKNVVRHLSSNLSPFLNVKYFDFKVDSSQVEELRTIVAQGKSTHKVADRDLHQWWDEYKKQVKAFNDTFEAEICSDEASLREKFKTINDLVKKVSKSFRSI